MSGVYIHAVGINNAMGSGLKEIASKLFDKPQTYLTEHPKLNSGHSCFVGQVEKSLPELGAEYDDYNCRNNQLLLEAYNQIKDKTESMIEASSPDKFGVILGTSTSGIDEGEEAIKTNFEGYNYRRQEIGNPSEFLQKYIGAGKIAYTVSTACSSAGRAIVSAVRLLQSGKCDVVIAGGSDSLCNLTVNGFDSLSSISATGANPLSKNRDGISIGEGAALFLLSREPSDIEIKGYGESSDGYHISSPDPEAKGPELALRAALEMAGIEKPGYVNLHGTATPKNDEMESLLINRLFGDEVPVGSTKGMIGHCLGAAAAQELAFCYMALAEQLNPEHILPPHVWDGEIDPNFPKIRVVEAGERWTNPSVMSNSFAFGGNNISLVIGRA